MRNHFLFMCFTAACLASMAGCGFPAANVAEQETEETPKSDQDERSRDEDKQPKAAKDEKPSRDEKETAQQVKDPDKAWQQLQEQLAKQLDARELNQAQQTLGKLAQVYRPPNTPTEAQQVALAEATLKLAELRIAKAERRREAIIGEARAALADGQFDAAQQALERATQLAPSERQQRGIARLLAEVQRLRTQHQRIENAVTQLASPDRAAVLAAQEVLYERSQSAVPRLLSASRNEDPLLVDHALEALRRLRRPAVSQPAIVAVLANESQQGSWPVAIQHLRQAQEPGAGEALLELAEASRDVLQQVAALDALAVVVDPPVDTLPRVLPLIADTEPALQAAALRAARQAVFVHGQFELTGQMHLDQQLPGEALEQLDQLPAQLDKLSKQPPEEVAAAARRLAIALRLQEAEPLAAKVIAASYESKDVQPAALLDGQWKSTDLKTMWRHPADRPGWIVLDLGEERTIAGLRIWNWNEANAKHRGWKEVDIYVGNRTHPLKPTTHITLVPAPGENDPGDYHTNIVLPFLRGRFLKLAAREIWRPDSHAGLSEVEVLGE